MPDANEKARKRSSSFTNIMSDEDAEEEERVAENIDISISSCKDLIDRDFLTKFFTYSHKFQVFIVCMVMLDCLIVIVELLFDLGAIVKNDCEREDDCPVAILNRTHANVSCTANGELTKCLYKNGKLRCVTENTTGDVNPAEVLHILGILVLSVFLVEIIVKFYALGLTFFHHKLEVFDAIIVVISFALDVAYSGNEDAWDGIGLLILLRLWRVARIANGIIISVKKKAEKRAEEATKELKAANDEIQRLQDQVTHLQGDVQKLKTESSAL